MKEHIILSVPKGSVVRSGKGSIFTIKEVPENALELIENGATWLMFKESAKEPLKKLSEERLVKIIDMLKSQKRTRDVGIVEMALAEKKSGKTKDLEPNEKPAK
ncbi:hypothetical protein [Chryseobacterium sp. YIM B08800]|uniref:hypothetical protein n=1 Tax=Chryseobacterium sp. YIM B08800 TaxID=2984136 RepID=UPI00223F7AA4|nr:hypothetical protein [Chryseobacterium sp. YIM B08800]